MNQLKSIALCFVILFNLSFVDAATPKKTALTPEMANSIAKEAYIYGFPLVDNYRVMYSYVINTADPEYKGPFDKLINNARLMTPEDRAIQTPNSDTPYSFVWLDLRAEPMVLTIPSLEKERYFSIQFVDNYTFNFAYVGSRATGNAGGNILVAGPNWKGEPPPTIKKVIRCETDLAFAIYRTQLFNSADLQNVIRLQTAYKAQPLSVFMGKPRPAAAPAIQFLKPLTTAEERTSLEFFNVLAFALQFCPTHPSEAELRARFAKIGIEPGKAFHPESLPAAVRDAMQQGMEEAQKEIDTELASTTSAADGFGTREFMKNNYLKRAAGAQAGIYGNSKEEAFYFPYKTDSQGQPLNANEHRYEMKFESGKLPPVNAFWSVTMYSLPDQLLVANPLKRYLINSSMVGKLRKDPDGGTTLFLQKNSPGGQQEGNWLPCPNGPFFVVLRLYWPKPEVLTGEWKAPGIRMIK